MKKRFVLIPAAILAALTVQGESVSELLDPADLNNSSDWAESGDYIYDLNSAGDAVIVGYLGQGGDVVIPEKLGEYNVTGIASDAFQDADNVTSVTVPASVRAIGSGAFSGENLTDIRADDDNLYYMDRDGVLFTADGKMLWQYPSGRNAASYAIPDDVQTIGDNAFRYADGLITMEIPDTVEGIRHGAFYECQNLETVSIGAGVQVIGARAFTGEKLTGITVDDGNAWYCDVDGILFTADMTELLRYPAAGTDASYVIPDTVMSVGSAAFRDCAVLTEIGIPRSVSVIDDEAFMNCTGLKTVTLPRRLAFIGHRAFASCTQLSKVYFKGDCFEKYMIGNDAFAQCSADLVLYFSFETSYGWEFPKWEAPNGTNYVTDMFTPALWEYRITDEGTAVITAWNGNIDETNVLIPPVIDGYPVTGIGNHAFDGEYGIASVTIPAGVTFIGDRAFLACESIESVIIPAAVEKIGTEAFCCCVSLGLIRFLGDVPEQWGNEVLTGCAEELLIGYPAGLDTAWTTPYWTADDGNRYRTAPWGKNGMIGDVNADDSVDEEDGRILSQYFAGLDVSGELLRTDEADIDRDGSLTRRDCMILARILDTWANYTLDWRE